MSVRFVSLGSGIATPLFKVDIVESEPHRALALSSLTIVNGDAGPRFTNLAVMLPELTIGEATVVPRLGDQQLPRTFASSLLSGTSMARPLRGMSFSTSGSNPWSLTVGQLDTSSGAPTWSTGPAVTALAVRFTPYKRLSVAPRLLVPVSSEGGAETSLGTAIRAELSPHLSFTSDVGAADTSLSGWAPLAAASVLGQWRGAELEAKALRGAGGAKDAATIGTLDRELARAQLQPIPGLTISGLASWSRAAASHDAGSRLGSVGLIFDRMPFGQLAATSQRELYPSREVNTTRLGWRQTAGGFAVWYTERWQESQSPSLQGVVNASRLVEVDLPGWSGLDPGRRLEIRGVMAADPQSAVPTISSRLKGRFDIFGEVALVGETELGVATAGQQRLLRMFRLTSDVPVLPHTAVQFLYNYRVTTPVSFNQSFEARVSRTIPLFKW